MLQDRPQPDWSDGPANRELLKALDEMGGAGAELADPEVFRMLEEIERLTRDRLSARELLEGDGQALDLAEPRLGERNESLQKALLDAFAEPPEASSALAAGTPAAMAAPTPRASIAPAVKDPEVEAPRTPPVAAASAHIMTAIEASSVVIGTQPEAASPAALIPPVDNAGPESSAGPAPRKRRADPEDFLPPGFFDPRDRPPPRRWGRWVALGLLIATMLLVAGLLIRKNHNAGLGAQTAPLGDLTRPAR